MKKILGPVLFAFLLFSCGNKKMDSSNNNENITLPTDSAEMEIMAVNLVFDLPEVKQKTKEIEKNNEGDLSAFVSDYPHLNKKGYFRVEIEKANGDIGQLPLYVFDVFFPSLKICFWDSLEQKQIPIEEWRNLPK